MEQVPTHYQLKQIIESLETSLKKVTSLEREIKDALILTADLYERITDNND